MSDGFTDIREHMVKQAEFENKIKDAKVKRDKAILSGNQKDYNEAILADLDLIMMKLGI